MKALALICVTTLLIFAGKFLTEITLTELRIEADIKLELARELMQMNDPRKAEPKVEVPTLKNQRSEDRGQRSERSQAERL
jgi:hypothetical protein